MPTILDLCDVNSFSGQQFDGLSLKPLISGKAEHWPGRIIFTDTQRGEYLMKWQQFSVMTDRWRLVGKTELYDVLTDPGQITSVAQDYPEVVDSLIAAYEIWWDEVSVNAYEISYVKAGTIFENPIRLNSHDLHTEKGFPAWNQDMVRSATGVNGYWAVEIERSGKYEIKLYRWPKESNLRLNDPAPLGDEVPGVTPYPGGEALSLITADIKIGKQVLNKKITESDTCVSYILYIEKGLYKLECCFKDSSNTERVPYYVYVRYAGS
jgi:hypothetical protein